MKIHPNRYIFFLLLLMGKSLLAQENSMEDTLSLDEVVVTGTKVAVNREMMPLTISVIKSEEIQETSESALLPVLSARVPGVFVTQRGVTGFGVAAGSAGQISIRGVGGTPNTQVLVLLNGNPQYMGLMGHPLADAYVSSDVERVEVIRGPASTLYGSNAMGGVINIITKQGESSGAYVNARIMSGSYNTYKLMANGGYSIKGLKLSAGVNYDRTDGHRDSSDFSILTAYMQGKIKLGKAFELQAQYSLASFNSQDPGPVGETAGEKIDILRGMGALVLDNQTEKLDGSIRLFFNHGEHIISDGFNSRDVNYGLVIYESFHPFKGNSLTFGYDLKNYGGEADKTIEILEQKIPLVDTTIYEMAGYLHLQQEMFNKVTISAGYRLDYNSVAGHESIPTLGMTYQQSSQLKWRASFSKGFRNPTIRELFMWTPANSDLQAERVFSYEAGMLMRCMKDKLRLDITFYNARGDNLIKVVMAEGIPQYQNSGEFSNTGIELSADAEISDRLSLTTNYSFIHMKNPVLSSPRHQLYLGSNYTLRKVSFHMDWQWVNGLFTRITPATESDYHLLNAKVQYQISKRLSVFIKGENLLNQEYEINHGYPMPGIIGFIGMQAHLNQPK